MYCRNPAHPGIPHSNLAMTPSSRMTCSAYFFGRTKFCCERGFAIEKVRPISPSMVLKSMRVVLEIGRGHGRLAGKIAANCGQVRPQVVFESLACQCVVS